MDDTPSFVSAVSGSSVSWMIDLTTLQQPWGAHDVDYRAEGSS
jgi:hypothetical protein